jgi:hypothetical protein
VTDTLTRPLLIPTGDPTPVEQAAVEGIADMFEPETFLTITFHRPDGGARVWYAWTDGGRPLGDRIDTLAAASGMDGADWLDLSIRHARDSERGRIAIQAHPLRPVLGDVEGGIRAPGEFRDRLGRGLSQLGRSPARMPWLGFGPKLVTTR